MQAVIVAGGFGTRLRPLTYTRPKALIPLANRPMINYVLDILPKEVDKVVLAVNYMMDHLREYFDTHDLGKEIVLVEEKEPLGTGGAVKNCEEHIDGTFFVLNGDIISSIDSQALLAFHRAKGGMATLSLWPVENPEAYGIIEIDGEKRVRRFLEKPKRHEVFSNLINAGVYCLEPEVLDMMEPGRNISIEREVFPDIVATERGMYGYEFGGPLEYWVDAGKPETFLEANRAVLGKEGKAISFPEGCEDLSLVGRLNDYHFISLGKDVRVGSCTVLSNSVMLDRTAMGDNVEIRDSIVGENCKIGRGAVIHASVIGDGQEIKSGERLSGKRIGMREEV